MKRRVFVTGVGTVSALGIGFDNFVTAIRAGRSGVGPIGPVLDRTVNLKIAARVTDFEPQDWVDHKLVPLADRFTQFSLAATDQALKMAALDREAIERLGGNSAVVFGSGLGGQMTLEAGYAGLFAEGRRRFHPMSIPKIMPNAPASLVSMAYGVLGPAFCVTSACASSNHATGIAFNLVRSGASEIAITGGAEAGMTLANIKGWEALKVMASERCAPFSKNRTGMVLGEGAGTVILESEEHMRARGAEPLAEVLGCGMSADGNHITQVSAEGAARAVRAALDDAGIAPEQVDYINAHGSGTELNDRTETAVTRMVFAEHADTLAISSTKAAHGHAIAATGALELAATIGGIRDGFLPPTLNFTEPGEGCDLDFVPNEAREAKIGVAVSNSFAFGGLNAVLVLAAV
jgi:nodulation protein E